MSKSRIHCQTWNHHYARMDPLGVLWEDPAVVRKALEALRLTVREQLMADGNTRVWTLSKRQFTGRRAPKVSSPGQPANTAAI